MDSVKFYKRPYCDPRFPEYYAKACEVDPDQRAALYEGFRDEALSCIEHYLSGCNYPDYEIENVVDTIIDGHWGYELDALSEYRLDGDQPANLNALPPYEVGRMLWGGPDGVDSVLAYRDRLKEALEYEGSLERPDWALVTLCRKHLLDVCGEYPPPFGEYEEEDEDEE